ncbi:type II toxin-antitoxin system PemK/MazF family toxin [Rhodococcus sp. NPDC058505]|uniref:type II toxin-antitoxin system PemK/MazF family toxin n=1 Tax=Rhodococcus sp. NPDC058505 TaxID=3346531 RepID=UPI00365F32DB
MREIRLARLDKTHPVLVLTREAVIPHLTNVTVAPITSTIKGLSTEVPVDARNGLDHDSVVSCDNIGTIPMADLGRLIGYLHDDQEASLASAIAVAFDLDTDL